MIETVGVIGAGERGCGIAAICALAGCDVALTDQSTPIVDAALLEIATRLDRAVNDGRLPAEKRDGAIERLRGTTLSAAVQSALVIEAVPERLSTKQRLFEDIELAARPDTIFASATASMTLGKIGAGLLDRKRLVGLHFVDPERSGSLLEVVCTEETAQEVRSRALAFGAQLGKTVVAVQDSAGLVYARMAVLLTMEAVRLIDEGVASARDIDEVMVHGHGHPVGPLRLADMAGLDSRVWMGEHLATALRSPAYSPPESLRAKVEAGELGQKSGQGYFSWADD